MFIQQKHNKLNSINEEISEDETGEFPTDEPNEIIKIVPIQDSSEYMCLMSWKVRNNGIQPKNSFVKNEIVKLFCPLLLIKFLENHINFIRY